MSTYTHSLVVICPDAIKAQLLAFGEALMPPVAGGMDVPLSADGTAPATHWGSHSWATSEFVAIITGQVVPSIQGVTPEQIAAVLAQCTVSVDANGLTALSHFIHVVSGIGLQEITTGPVQT